MSPPHLASPPTASLSQNFDALQLVLLNLAYASCCFRFTQAIGWSFNAFVAELLREKGVTITGMAP